MPALALTPVEVLGPVTSTPVLRHSSARWSASSTCTCRSPADSLRIDARSGEVNRQFVPMGEGVSRVVMRGTEAQLLVVGDRARYVRDHEDRLDTDDALHTQKS